MHWIMQRVFMFYFYVDDGLTGAESVQEAIELQQQMQALIPWEAFLLRKWNYSDPQVCSRVANN